MAKPNAEAKKAAVCPKCASGDLIPYAYGYPSIETGEAWQQGKVMLGGCVIPSPDGIMRSYSCKNCGTDIDATGKPCDPEM